MAEVYDHDVCKKYIKGSQKENRKSHLKKVFESMIMAEQRIPWYMHIIFLLKILGIFAVSLTPIIIQNWIKKNASKGWKVIANSKV